MLRIRRNSIFDDVFELTVLEGVDAFAVTGSFNCADGDLNDFFHKDAFPHSNEFLAKTYAFRSRAVGDGKPPAALVCFFNDSIFLTDQEARMSAFRRYLKKRVPYPKRGYKSFPSVKIGRLGVQKEWQNHGIGTSLLNMAKEFFIYENRTGCRFLTVDAYNNPHVLNFYRKNDFDFLTSLDASHKTRTMFFDLKSLRHNGQ